MVFEGVWPADHHTQHDHHHHQLHDDDHHQRHDHHHQQDHHTQLDHHKDYQVVFDGEPDQGVSDGLTGCYKVSIDQ